MDSVIEFDSVAYANRIDLSRYDRAPALTHDELQIAQRWTANAVITRRQLPRLYAPLADILLHDGRDRTNRLRSVKYVLTEVGRVGQAYWGWNEQHWLDLIDHRPALRQLSMTPQLTAIEPRIGWPAQVASSMSQRSLPKDW